MGVSYLTWAYNIGLHHMTLACLQTHRWALNVHSWARLFNMFPSIPSQLSGVASGWVQRSGPLLLLHHKRKQSHRDETCAWINMKHVSCLFVTCLCNLHIKMCQASFSCIKKDNFESCDCLSFLAATLEWGLQWFPGTHLRHLLSSPLCSNLQPSLKIYLPHLL